MADGTKIEWAHAGLGRGASWNPIRARNLARSNSVGHYCEHVSPGCVNCYAEAWNRDRFGTLLPYKPGWRANVEIFLDENTLGQPLRWREPRGIFVGSMTDIFGAFVSDEMLDRIFAVAALCRRHRFLFLTKRSARMREYVTTWFERLATRDVLVDHPTGRRNFASMVDWSGLPSVLPNVWLGVSAEDQARSDERRADLAALAGSGWTTFVSYEPALGPVDWTGWEFLKWFIGGGESGLRARPSHPAWHRASRDFCTQNGVAYFFKQWGEWKPICEMSEGESEAAYHPAPLKHPDATRRCKVAHEVLHATGERWQDPTVRGAFQGGKQAMTMFRLGKHRTGRTLDGRMHDAMPARAV